MATTIASPVPEDYFPSDAYFKDSASSESEKTLVTELSDIPLPPVSNPPNEILSLDKDTPDNHVARDSRLIRLTGAHPFNVEPPLTELFNEGFLTSPELFYVRNHGPVPRVLDDEIVTWELSVEGMVEQPIVLSFRQILQEFHQITVPVTLVCAGNRRKEQNQVRRSKGFSWGAAGVSTSLFTGPMMSDIIQRARPLRRARYVCMEGDDKLPNGYYGTSLKLNWVMDKNRGIMLAHKMNGEPLRPDHGRPLRAVVPGQIGGRSVKWLKRLIVTELPSDNWYHIYDNRVLPTMVSSEMSSSDGSWWLDERYAIYDLSVNSAAAYPQHNEELQVTTHDSLYTAKGYAYSGGGRRVSRVEISLDNGKSWLLARLDYPEDKYREYESELYGGLVDMHWRETCFCWCIWAIDIPIAHLETSEAILVRAMDEAMNIQPRDIYWSVLGMMNNPWFRITIAKEDEILKFSHPTQPGLIPGGWMEQVKNESGDLLDGYWGKGSSGLFLSEPLTVQEIEMTARGQHKAVGIDELRKHASPKDPWFVINSEVYDASAYLEDHPGGAQSIISAAGTDASDEFLAIHSETAKAMMSKYHVGTLSKLATEILKNERVKLPTEEKRNVFLQPGYWMKATLCEKRTVSHDSRVFTLALEHNEQALGLPVGQHIMLKVSDPSSVEDHVVRSYTPISHPDRLGAVELLVKIYFKTPISEGGKMTMALENLAMGSSIEIKGPIGKFIYHGKGKVSINGKERAVKSLRMICGGSGITPIFQVLGAVMKDTEDRTTCVVLDGNKREEDILCKEALNVFSAADESKCSIVHTLTNATSSWIGPRGRISADLLKEWASPAEEYLTLICGPPAMEQFVRRTLLELGWDKSDIILF